MSSTSSVCSSNDVDFALEKIPMRRDIERFSLFIGKLRAALDVNTNVVDGDAMCVNVHASLEMVNEAMRDLFRYDQFKTNQVIIPSLQLVQSVKDLKFDSALVDTSKVHELVDQLEAAVLNTLIVKHGNTQASRLCATLQRKHKTMNEGSIVRTRANTLQRRHSKYNNDADYDEDEVTNFDKILNERVDGVEIAFERTKLWSNYCKDIIAYVRARLTLEQAHTRAVSQLVETTRKDLTKPYLPLSEVLESSFDCDVDLSLRTRETTEHIKDRVVEALETRRKEHDATRATLKLEWSKLNKTLIECEDAHEKAMLNLRTREETLRKARENSLRSESVPCSSPVDLSRRRKELEKKRRSEEEAMMRKDEAEKHVRIIGSELRRKKNELELAKERVLEKLRELVFQCDQTTKACTAHYFKALASLYVKLPGKYQELADATRDYQPGSAYMAYLNTLPVQRSNSSHSLLKSDRSVDEGVSCDGSITSHRRNALNPDDEGAIPDTKRHKKTSLAGRLFDSEELSDAAQSHCVHRSMQPAKCTHCETLSILYTLQCISCGAQFHRTCFPKTSFRCGQSTRSSMSERRVSVFGVSLRGQLESQHRSIPLIIECCVEQLQRRGMRVKGIYRTCGVKSKIEEICESFERRPSEEISLDHVHPMNLASVVKLYLRKLPEPLLTYDLYNDWVRVGTQCSDDERDVELLKELVERLPRCNYETLKFLLLHFNRVTWFEKSNLMCASNMSTVVAPSLIWHSAKSADYTAVITHAQHTNKAVEVMIRNAFRIFNVDRTKDWHEFFAENAVEQPVKEDVDGNESDEEDANDDTDDVIDDDQMFVPQPATPDLLKTARNAVDTSEPSTCAGNSSPEEPQRAPRRRARDKRRSYTTSILIGRDIDNAPTSTPTPTIPIRKNSDDVVVDVGKGQIFIDRSGNGRVIERRQSHKEFTRSDVAYTPQYKDSQHIINLSNVGDLFPGTEQDVSYV